MTTQSAPDDHKAYYPGATPVHIRITGDRASGRLLGAQLVGHRSAEVSKRVDTYATALFHTMTVDALNELDLSYTPPLGSPWDATQIAAQAWIREHQLDHQRRALITDAGLRGESRPQSPIDNDPRPSVPRSQPR